MFVQFITARVIDEAGIEAAMKRWEQELRTEAIGFLGSTSGITTKGELIVVARFESAQAAQANSDRPEQTEWWNELQPSIAEPVFFNSDEVYEYGQGGSDTAGFVQVITARAKDPQRLKALDQEMDDVMRDARPDVIGGVAAWQGDRFVQTVYFTNESEARKYEASPLDPSATEKIEEMQRLSDDLVYYDLLNPIMVSP